MLNTVVIYGQNHKGSTYHIACIGREIDGNLTEFSCQGLDEFCFGYGSCFNISKNVRIMKNLLH